MSTIQVLKELTKEQKLYHMWADILDATTCRQIRGSYTDHMGGKCALQVLIDEDLTTSYLHDDTFNIRNDIASRNDVEQWSFKQIASWLRTL
jgi:hypothetical protein